MVVDGAQSTPHMPVNVQELGADFFAFSGHKVYGPMGIGGAVRAGEDLLEEMPPFLSGRRDDRIRHARRAPSMPKLPHKFEAGTVNAAGAAGLACCHPAMCRASASTPSTQREHDRDGQRPRACAVALPHVHVLGTDKPEDHNGIITFAVDGVHPHDISEMHGVRRREHPRRPPLRAAAARALSA